MSGRTDIAKGRVKEATGVLTGNEKLQKKGQKDQAVGRFRKVAEKTSDRIAKKMRG